MLAQMTVFIKKFDLFRERLLNVNLSSVDVRTRQEVHMFLTAIEKNPPVMNLNGYANINRKLISSVSRLTEKIFLRLSCSFNSQNNVDLY